MAVKSLTLTVMIESSKEPVNLVRISVKENSGKKAIKTNLHCPFLNSLSYLRVLNSFQEATVTCLRECVHVRRCVWAWVCVYICNRQNRLMSISLASWWIFETKERFVNCQRSRRTHIFTTETSIWNFIELITDIDCSFLLVSC